MPEVVRFSISTDERLLERFDAHIAEKGYLNRSEAIRDLIRGALAEEVLGDDDAAAVGTVTLVYDHHFSDLGDKLTEHQHLHHESIVSTLHIHLDHHHCLEVVVLRGRYGDIRHLAEGLISTKGVTQGRFVATAAGDDLL